MSSDSVPFGSYAIVSIVYPRVCLRGHRAIIEGEPLEVIGTLMVCLLRQILIALYVFAEGEELNNNREKRTTISLLMPCGYLLNHGESEANSLLTSVMPFLYDSFVVLPLRELSCS